MQHFRFFTDHTLSVWISLYIKQDAHLAVRVLQREYEKS